MSVFTRLRMLRALLGAGIIVRALLCGIVAGATLLICAAFVDEARALSPHVRLLLLVVAMLAAVATTAVLLWRDRGVASLRRVALWVEERHPAIEYMLITAVESGAEPRAAIPGASGWTATAWRRLARALSVPVAALVAAAIVLLLLPQGAVARIRAPHPGDALERARANPDASRLSPLVASVTPPAYSGVAASTLDEPTDIHALVGTRIVVRGRGPATGIVALSGGDTLRANPSGDEWSLPITLGTRAIALRLVDRQYRRIVALEPIIDAPPSVTLTAPAHDTVLRAPRGHVALSADARDDFGIASASFEYIVSSGEGETFTFKSGTVGAVQPRSTRAALAATLSLDALGLKPGDVIHLRAVARDGNNVNGPGIGTSETRTIRIARADEYDSVAVDAAAPSDADKGAISERMLITLAEALVKKQPSLAHDATVAESRSIGLDQARLRRQVGDIVFSRLGGNPSGEEQSGDDAPQRVKSMQALLARADSATTISEDPVDFGAGESPVVAVNKPLLEAYNAMWDAGSSLDIGEPAKALPHMRAALAAIERARQVERVYLRGQPPQVVIDVAKVRLQGKDKGASSVRRPQTASDAAAEARDARFMRIVELAEHNSGAAADSLLLLRIDAVGDNAAFASALADAASALRAGRGADATAAFIRARRLLAGAPAVRDSLGRWGVGGFDQ